jgi:threonine aldolase
MSDSWMVGEARAIRRRLGGGMRQVGVLAAAGIFALMHNLERLAEDHARARRLAEAVAGVGDGLVDVDAVETNIVIVELAGTSLDSASVAARCRADGVLVSAFGPRRVRLVTHLDIDDAAIDRAIEVITRSLRRE